MNEPPEGFRFLIQFPDAKDRFEVLKFLLDAYGTLAFKQAIIREGSQKAVPDKHHNWTFVEQETGYTVYVPRGLRI